MMFEAGIGNGMLTFAMAEPMYHFATNPAVIMGLAEGSVASRCAEIDDCASIHAKSFFVKL